jgi:hypothetical protein
MEGLEYLERSARPRTAPKRVQFANLEEGQLVSAPFMLETPGWTAKQRVEAWAKVNVGVEKFHEGSISRVHRVHKTLDITYFDGDTAIHVPMQLVKRTEYDDYASEALAKETKITQAAAQYNSGRIQAKAAMALKGYKWKHTGTRTMRFAPANPAGPKAALADRLLMDNTFALHIGGKWVQQPDLETVSLRQAVNSIHSDIYVRAMW